jgi:hypothetical protein
MVDESTTAARADDVDLPEWDDEYFDRVADRLAFNYDLERQRRVRGEEFTLYGKMEMSSEKHFFHPMLRFGYHETTEHLFARRRPAVAVSDLERLVSLGHDLADGWIDPDEEHFSTDFTFVAVVEEIPDDVRDIVAGFRDRTLLRYGYYGHYEINLVAVAPEPQDIVSSREAHVEEAFRLWDPIEKEEPGLWKLITRRLQI